MTRNNPIRNTAVLAARMTDALQKGQHTYDSLADLVGLSKVAVATWIKVMRKAGFVHVSGWAEDVRGRKFTPMFSWGAGPDIARAGQARTSAERMRAYRARMKATGGAA